MRGSALLVAVLLVIPALDAQTPPPQVLIKAGRLIDGRLATPQTNVGILISGERILAVGPVAQITARAPGARVIDLSQMTVDRKSTRRNSSHSLTSRMPSSA